MSAPRRPERIVDSHLHFWDPANTDWYPYLSKQRHAAVGDVTGMARRFDAATYASEAAGWNVEKLVVVAAASGLRSVEETLALDQQADEAGQPAAIIGGLTPTASVAEAEALLDRQAAAARFRGVRPMGGWDRPLPDDDVLRALRDRDLVFDLMVRPDGLLEAARGLAAHPDLVVVVEHLGWPRSGSAEEHALWRAGIDALAELGPNVRCKISGLAMPLGELSAATFGPWVEHVLEVFGVDRCFFGSNFPVDGMRGSLDALWSTYLELTQDLSDADRAALFADNAERTYRC